jgi:hypothetical protein
MMTMKINPNNIPGAIGKGIRLELFSTPDLAMPNHLGTRTESGTAANIAAFKSWSGNLPELLLLKVKRRPAAGRLNFLPEVSDCFYEAISQRHLRFPF